MGLKIDVINAEIQAWYAKDEAQLFKTLSDVQAWLIEDEIHGVTKRGYYISVGKGKKRFGVSISRDGLVEMLAEIDSQGA